MTEQGNLRRTETWLKQAYPHARIGKRDAERLVRCALRRGELLRRALSALETECDDLGELGAAIREELAE